MPDFNRLPYSLRSQGDKNCVPSGVVFGNILAAVDYFTGLELAFVVTKFPQKVRVKGITNWFILEYMTARVQ